MSIIVNFQQVTPATLDFIIANTSYLKIFLFGPDADFDTEPDDLLAVMTENDKIEPIDTDKSWGGILYLLEKTSNNQNPPLSAAILGMEAIGDEELDDEESEDGPARYLTQAQVNSLAQALITISEEDFFANYDPTTMNDLEVYPVWWSDENSVDDKSYVWEHFTGMTSYYKDASSRGNGMIIYRS